MQRIDNILEKWATMYKPLSHDPQLGSKKQAFFRIDSLNKENAFVRNYNIAHSPSMAYSSVIEAELTSLNDKVIDYRHVVYFMLKQKSESLSKTAVSDDNEAAEIKFELDTMVQDLVAFLVTLKQAILAGADKLMLGKRPFVISSDVRLAMQGFVESSAEWATIPMKFNGWWYIGVQFSRRESRKLCVISEKYI